MVRNLITCSCTCDKKIVSSQKNVRSFILVSSKLMGIKIAFRLQGTSVLNDLSLVFIVCYMNPFLGNLVSVHLVSSSTEDQIIRSLHSLVICK